MTDERKDLAEKLRRQLEEFDANAVGRRPEDSAASAMRMIQSALVGNGTDRSLATVLAEEVAYESVDRKRERPEKGDKQEELYSNRLHTDATLPIFENSLRNLQKLGGTPPSDVDNLRIAAARRGIETFKRQLKDEKEKGNPHLIEHVQKLLDEAQASLDLLITSEK